MGMMVVTGAQCVCSFGTAPGTLKATGQSGYQAQGKTVATVTDCQPNINLTPFGMCISLLNPAVASATAAALGVLTPQPCSFVPAGTWLASNPKLMASGRQCLTDDATVTCGVGGGSIRVTVPGQTSVMV